MFSNVQLVEFTVCVHMCSTKIKHCFFTYVCVTNWYKETMHTAYASESTNPLVVLGLGENAFFCGHIQTSFFRSDNTPIFLYQSK